MASIEEHSTTKELTVADVITLLPEKGKEIVAVHKSNIAWVRGALAALAILVDDKSAHGECKATLFKYYINPNAAKSEVDEVDGSVAKSTEKDDALFRAIRARGVLLKNAPSPQKANRVFTGRRTRNPALRSCPAA